MQYVIKTLYRRADTIKYMVRVNFWFVDRYILGKLIVACCAIFCLQWGGVTVQPYSQPRYSALAARREGEVLVPAVFLAQSINVV